MAARGVPLYASPPDFWITNYPPLSFHLVGWIGRALGQFVLAGRIVSLLSLVATSCFAGAAAARLAASRWAGCVTGACLLLWIATFTTERRGMDDPGLLADAIVTLALLVSLPGRSGTSRPVASGALFAVALFVKQDVLALPIAVGAILVLSRQWRSLLLWTVASGVTGLVLLALTFRLDGVFLFAHLLRSRLYEPRNLVSNVGTYALHFGAILAVVSVGMARGRRGDRRRPALLLLVTNLVSLGFAGGDGVALNVFYPPMIALAVALGSVLRPRDIVDRPRFTRLVLSVSVLAGMVPLPILLRQDVRAWRHLPELARETRLAVDALRAVPGPAICEDILLCFDAGKPIGPDPFFVDDQLAIGVLPKQATIHRLASEWNGAVEIDGALGPVPERARSRRRFDAAYMRALLRHDRVVFADGRFTVLAPKSDVDVSGHG